MNTKIFKKFFILSIIFLAFFKLDSSACQDVFIKVKLDNVTVKIESGTCSFNLLQIDNLYRLAFYCNEICKTLEYREDVLIVFYTLTSTNSTDCFFSFNNGKRDVYMNFLQDGKKVTEKSSDSLENEQFIVRVVSKPQNIDFQDFCNLFINGIKNIETIKKRQRLICYRRFVSDWEFWGIKADELPNMQDFRCIYEQIINSSKVYSLNLSREIYNFSYFYQNQKYNFYNRQNPDEIELSFDTINQIIIVETNLFVFDSDTSFYFFDSENGVIKDKIIFKNEIPKPTFFVIKKNKFAYLIHYSYDRPINELVGRNTKLYRPRENVLFEDYEKLTRREQRKLLSKKIFSD